MVSTAIGAVLGSLIDGADGDDSTVDGAITGAATAMIVRAVVPVAFTYFVGWAVLKGIGAGRDTLFGKGGND